MRACRVGAEPGPRAVAELAERRLGVEQRLERQVGGAGRGIGRQQNAAGVELPAADPLEQFV